MKIKLSTLFYLLFSLSICAQNYAPFNQNVSKRFHLQGNTDEDEYFLHIESVDSLFTLIAGDTLYYQKQFKPYFIGRDVPYFEPDNCTFWGFGSERVIDTTWLGPLVKQWSLFSLDQYIFYNRYADSLQLDFEQLAGDSALFFTAAQNDKYYLKYVGIQAGIVLGQAENLKVFRILHYDSTGNPMQTPLHNFEIKIGEHLGLVSFFDVFNFPVEETPLLLKGQTNPPLGYFQMTLGEVFDWHVGDVLQYKGTYSALPGYYPSSSSFSQYTVIDRMEDNDTVKIYFDVVSSSIKPSPWFGTFNISYPNPLVFNKKVSVIDFPYNKAFFWDFDMYSVDSVSYCGIDHEGIRLTGRFHYFCAACACFGPADGDGQFIEIADWGKGIGVSSMAFVPYGYMGTVSRNASLVYSNINGFACGNFIPNIGISESYTNEFEIWPNPANDILHTSLSFERVAVYDANGRIIPMVSQPGNSLDISLLADGFYVLEFLVDAKPVRKRIVKQ